MLSLVTAGAWSALREPSKLTRSVVQYIAAGAVFAGLTAEVLRRLLEDLTSPWIMGVGMALGLSLTLFIRSYGKSADGGMVLGFTIIIADVLIDGVLMGLAINAGSNPPGMIAIVFVLVPELVFLGLSLKNELGEVSGAALSASGCPD